MTAPRVPNELISQIISNITDQSTLFTLLLVSRDVQYEAERAIYHTIDYDNITNQLKKTLSDRSSPRCQRIAPLVRKLDNVFVNKRNPLHPYLRSVLENLSNIHTLHLNHSPYIGSMLRGCSFRLQVLRCYIPFDDDLLQFLQSQTGLIELTWHNSKISSKDIRKTNVQLLFFPRLRVLGGGETVVQTLLPTHHSVTNLSVQLTVGISASHSLVVQALDLFYYTPQQYRTLADQFPNLRYLHGAVNLPTGWDVNSVAEDFIVCIARLKNLEKLELLMYPITASDQEFIASKLIGWHTRLQTVDIINRIADSGGEWRDLSWASGTE